MFVLLSRGLIFGLSEEQSKNAISHTCRRVLLKAESRRYGKTVMVVRNVGGLVQEDDEDSEEADAESGEDDDDDDDEEEEEDFDGYADNAPASKKPKLNK